MKKYVFSKWDEIFGTGDEQIFNSEAEAVKTSKSEWCKMAFSDKERYLKNPISEFRVFEIEIENEDVLEDEILAAFETKEIWNARIELIVEFRMDSSEWQTLERIKGIDKIEKFDFDTFLENEVEFMDNCKNIEVSDLYEYVNYNFDYVCRNIKFTDLDDEHEHLYEYRIHVYEIY